MWGCVPIKLRMLKFKFYIISHNIHFLIFFQSLQNVKTTLSCGVYRRREWAGFGVRVSLLTAGPDQGEYPPRWQSCL